MRIKGLTSFARLTLVQVEQSLIASTIIFPSVIFFVIELITLRVSTRS